MKILSKIITTYIIVAVLAITLKLGDNILAKASTSNIADQCGINNGWVWNGNQCVNTCDTFHPWDPNQNRCSNTSGSYYNTNYYNNIGNCATYGSNFYFNGTNCVQINPGQNVSYNGSNPYSGGYTYINNNQNYNNTNYNGVIYYDNGNYTNTNNTNTNCGGYNNGCVSTCSSCWVNPAPKIVTTYQTYSYAEYIAGTPIYTYGTPNYNYNYNNTCWYNNSNYCNCNDYIHTGYYDSYGYYHN